jgi:hypothetical protein
MAESWTRSQVRGERAESKGQEVRKGVQVKKQLTIVIDVHDNGSSWATIDPPEGRRPTIGVHRRRFGSDDALLAAIAAALYNARAEAAPVAKKAQG